MPYLMPDDEWDRRLLRAFGIQLRRSRMRAGFSQVVLAERSGVSQTTISRLERGRAPAVKVYKIALLGEVLGTSFPLGFCPHDHYCAWRPLREDGTEVPRHDPLDGREDYYTAMLDVGSKD